MIRALKIILILFVGLQGLFYGLQNIVNLDAARTFVAPVLTMAGHEAYPAHFGPAVTAPFLIDAALWLIIAGELAVGALALKGVLDMTAAFRAPPARFLAASQFGVLSCGVAMIVWFGLFMVFGGAYFQMWQTALGDASFDGAFAFAMSSAAVMIFVSLPEPAPAP